jgi:hypothetical protein
MPLIVPSRSFYRHQIVGESSKPMCVAILCRDSPILSTIGFFQPNYAFSHLRTTAVTPTIGAIVCPDIVCSPALLLSQFVLSFLQMRGDPVRSRALTNSRDRVRLHILRFPHRRIPRLPQCRHMVDVNAQPKRVHGCNRLQTPAPGKFFRARLRPPMANARRSAFPARRRHAQAISTKPDSGYLLRN